MHTLKKTALSLLSLLLPLTVWAAAPSNDNFGSAIALTGDTPFITTVDISEATKETGDVSTGYQSVWYSWTPDKTMRVTMTLTGTITSTDDTVNDLTGYIEIFAGKNLDVARQVIDRIIGAGDRPGEGHRHAHRLVRRPRVPDRLVAGGHITSFLGRFRDIDRRDERGVAGQRDGTAEIIVGRGGCPHREGEQQTQQG